MNDKPTTASESVKRRNSLVITALIVGLVGIGVGFAFATKLAATSGSGGAGGTGATGGSGGGAGAGGQCWRIKIGNGSGNCTAGGPRCASTQWISGSGCFVTGFKSSSCQCFEGETVSCDLTTGSVCSPFSATCGVRYCQITGVGASLASAYEPTCHPVP